MTKSYSIIKGKGGFRDQILNVENHGNRFNQQKYANVVLHIWLVSIAHNALEIDNMTLLYERNEVWRLWNG